MNKRFDIQALRAVAVIAVLLFHSGFLLNAGYLGVDVFFVVSGFVVTQLILRRIHSEGPLDLLAFWRKRVRRLFPGLALMVLVVSPVSLLVFPRLEEASAGLITATAGMFSAANVSWRCSGQIWCIRACGLALLKMPWMASWIARKSMSTVWCV